MKIKNIPLQCLVDSGSGSTVMSTKLAKRLGLKVRPCTDDQPLFSASGAQLKVTGITDVTFYLNGLRIPHTVKVIDGLFPNLVIGVEFMQANRMSVNYADGTVRFYDDLIVIPLQGYDSRDNCAVITENVCIPGFAEIAIPVVLPKQYANQCVVLESLQNCRDLVAVAGTISQANGRRAVVKVLNYKPFSIVLKKRTKIASVIPPKSIAAIHRFQTPETQENVPIIMEQTPDVLEQFAKDYKLDLNPNLTSDQRHTLLTVMYQYKGVFARSLRDVQIYRGMELDF